MKYKKTFWGTRVGLGVCVYYNGRERLYSLEKCTDDAVISWVSALYNCEHMNHIEEGICQAHLGIETETKARQRQSDMLNSVITEIKQHISKLYEANKLLRDLIESKLGCIKVPISLVTEDGSYLVTESGYKLVV